MDYVDGFQEAMDEQDAEAEAAAAEKNKNRAIGEDGEEIEPEPEGRFAFINKARIAATGLIQDELIGNVATEMVGEDAVDDFLGEVEAVQEETAGDEEGDGADGTKDGADGTKDGADAGQGDAAGTRGAPAATEEQEGEETQGKRRGPFGRRG